MFAGVSPSLSSRRPKYIPEMALMDIKRSRMISNISSSRIVFCTCNDLAPDNIEEKFYHFADDEHEKKKYKPRDGVEQQPRSEHCFGFLQQRYR